MSSPKFSVLIAAYNAEKYLDECIQSILVQKYQDYEVLLLMTDLQILHMIYARNMQRCAVK